MSSSSSSSHREFDLIIFGATGFTGFYVMRELLISIQNGDHQHFKNLKWAVAGRSFSKLVDKLIELEKELKRDLTLITKIVADVDDQESLIQMARRTRLVINCVGPYQLYGRPVVDACVQSGTHHIDISGEPNYIESMIVEFYEKAKEKQLVIVSTCGWDSIPCDLGVEFAKQKFNGRLHSVETFVEVFPGAPGYKMNFGTFHSIIQGYKDLNKIGDIRRRLFNQVFIKKLPKSRINLKRRLIPFRRPEINGWNVEFPGSDRSVVQRTQYYNYEHYQEAPLQIQTYYVLSNFTKLIGLLFFVMVFGILNTTGFGRRLLHSYPHIFTFGAFSKNGPSREQIESCRFQTTILGRGWTKETLQSENITDIELEPSSNLDGQIIVKVTGADPAYIATSTCLVQSGLTILFELDQIPKGVLSPASAFRNTTLLKRLQERGLKMKVVSD